MPRPKQTTYEVLPQDGRLNVLVLYTPKVRQALGEAQKVRLFLSKVLEQTNQGYEQSGVKLRVNIAALGELDYAESGDAEKDLESLSQAAIANNWRRQAKVDVISLWVSTLKNACGVANLNQTPADFQKEAFNVVDISCAMDNFSFAHELGHNLGSCHDQETEKNCVGSFPYSHGYQDSEGDFRTIMSYPCAANKDCPRLNYWSSPKLVVNDKKPMGVADQVDNARSLNHVT